MAPRAGRIRIVLGLFLGSVGLASGAAAHHGTAISYQTDKPYEVKAVVKEFVYANPHCTMFFETVDEKGTVTFWNSELTNHPARMSRMGWTKARTEAALKPGTRVTLTVAAAKVVGNTVLVMRIMNEKGEQIAGRGLETQ